MASPSRGGLSVPKGRQKSGVGVRADIGVFLWSWRPDALDRAASANARRNGTIQLMLRYSSLMESLGKPRWPLLGNGPRTRWCRRQPVSCAGATGPWRRQTAAACPRHSAIAGHFRLARLTLACILPGFAASSWAQAEAPAAAEPARPGNGEQGEAAQAETPPRPAEGEATRDEGEAPPDEGGTPPDEGEPPATATDESSEVFVPTENISEDIAVPFPVDI